MRETPSFGSYVVDSEAFRPDVAVVVNRPGVKAKHWDTNRGESTVAADNRGYSPDSPVIVVVFVSDLEQWDPNWEERADGDLSLQTLASDGVPFYAFPAERLEEAPPDMLQNAIDPVPELTKLIQLLEDSGISYELEDEQTIVCRKFGETYRLQPGKLVSGTGVMAGRLESMAEDVA